MTYTKTFESITQIPGWIADHPDVTGESEGGSLLPPSPSWDGNVGFDGAVDMAKQGGYWAEGAKLMREAVATAVDLKDRAKIDTVENDVAGFMPDIDAYIAGQPDNMLNLEEGEELESPVISIGVHIGRAASVTQQEAVNRGAAILSMIDDIEHKGLRVELWAIWRNKWSGQSADIRIKLKDAQDTWSPHSVAFALCHGGMNRRLIFRIVEGQKSLRKMVPAFGVSMDGKPDDMDIWFPRVNEDERWKWGTMDHAIATATSTLNKQLKEK